MNATLRLLAAAGVLALAPTLLAADTAAKPADKKDDPKAAPVPAAGKCAPGQCSCAQAAKQKTVMLTGSNIPQEVTRVGRITDSAAPVTVVTHDDLEKTGDVNLAAALRKSVPTLH